MVNSGTSDHELSTGESIPIYALTENRPSRIVVQKAVVYQIQTYTSKGNVVMSDTSSRWNGNTLKIPPVSPSILNSGILRVENLLAVSKNVMMII
uniref:Uncharacterized protein n=1 Tax=Cyprinus carpio TaxID=7962 RepID=A0A8C1FYV1_CYPCA